MRVAIDQVTQGGGARSDARMTGQQTRSGNRMQPVASPEFVVPQMRFAAPPPQKRFTVFLDAPPATCQDRLACGSAAGGREWGGEGFGGGMDGGLLAQVDNLLFERVASLLLLAGGSVGAAKGDGEGDGEEAGGRVAVDGWVGGGVLVMDWREVGRAEDVWNMVRGATEGSFAVPSLYRAPTGFQVSARARVCALVRVRACVRVRARVRVRVCVCACVRVCVCTRA
jgi:hypothetical protein